MELRDLIEHGRQQVLHTKRELTLAAKIFACFCMVELALLLICNFAGLRLFAYGEAAEPVPMWPLKMVTFVLGPVAIALVLIGFGFTDIAQEFLPPSWKNEIDTMAAVKVAAHLIGIDLVVLAEGYFFNPASAPLAYTGIILGTIIALYMMSPLPKSVVRSKGK